MMSFSSLYIINFIGEYHNLTLVKGSQVKKKYMATTIIFQSNKKDITLCSISFDMSLKYCMDEKLRHEDSKLLSVMNDCSNDELCSCS